MWRAYSVSLCCNMSQTESNTTECAFQKIVANTDLCSNKLVLLHFILNTVDCETCRKLHQKMSRNNRVSLYCNMFQTVYNTTECAFQKTVFDTDLRSNNFVQLLFILNTVDCKTCRKCTKKCDELTEFRHIAIFCRRPSTQLSALFKKMCLIQIFAARIL